MRLIINRSQQDVKGMFGGHKGVSFTLAYKLELTAEESDLVKRYGLSYYPITWHTVQGTRTPDDTIENMTLGRSQSVSDVTTLLKNEQVVKDACDALPRLFEVCRSFGGSEVIDYPRTGSR